MSKKRPIIENIKIYQSIVKDKTKTSKQRRMAYLELKRLNTLKETGSFLKMPDYKMINVSKKHKPYEHNYFVYSTDKKNNVKVNKVTHGKISNKKYIPSLNSYIGLRIIDSYQRKDKSNFPLKYYDFHESNLNNMISNNEKNNILSGIRSLDSNKNKI